MMVAMAAMAGPQRLSLRAGTVLDGEKVFVVRGGAAVLVRVGSVARRGAVRCVGLRELCVRAAPRSLRVAALPEEGVATEAAVEKPAVAERAVEAPAYEGPTVKVKFELQRECHFGQQFKVVGSDPQFGDWDPSAALGLTWSEGHLWTVEVDVPEGKTFEYKYVLCGQDGEVDWQPGSNHVLEATAGAGSLVASEPWEEPQSEPVAELEVQPAEREVRPPEPEVQPPEPEVKPAEPQSPSAESDTRDWEAVSDDAGASSPADALADATASAAVGALNAGVKAATALEGGLDSLSDSPNRETNGVAESKEETPTSIEIPVIDAALAASAAPTAPAEEPTTKNGATTTSKLETATTEEKLRIQEQSKMEAQPSIEEKTTVEPKKRLSPLQKDIEWLSSLFRR